MEGGSTSEPWTCERGMKSMRPNAGFCDKGPSSHEAARSSRILSWISSPRIVCLVVIKCPEQTRRICPRVRDENPGVPKCHVQVRVSKASNGTSRFVTRENRAIPKIARLRRSFSQNAQANRIVCGFSPTGVSRSNAVDGVFFSGRRARRGSARRRDGVNHDATPRGKETRYELLARELRVFTHDTRLPCQHLARVRGTRLSSAPTR